MPQLLTKPGTGRLSDLARHVVVPSGIETSGWPAVRDRCKEFGVEFDPWQDGAGRLILAKRADGSYAASIGGVVMSIPRQVGKTFLIGAIVFALCLLNPGLTVLWTAHRLRTADETFAKMQAFSRRAKVRAHIAKVVLGSGDEEIQFHNGSRILFGARERGFGRGFDDVDLEVFDEAQILTENAIDDMVPAMNAAVNPLPIFIGTPPKPSDPSEVFTARRAAALSGDDEDTAYIEFSADPDASPDDRKQWAKANPSFPGRTPETAMLRMQKLLTADSFPREGLGIWPDEIKPAPWEFVPESAWTGCASKEPADVDQEGWLVGTVDLAIEVSFDRSSASVAVAGECREGGVGLEVIRQAEGTGWVAGFVAGLKADEAKPVGRVALDAGGPAASLVPDLEAVGVEVTEAKFADMKTMTSGLHDAIVAAGVVHRCRPELTEAAGHAVKRTVGDVELIDRRVGAPAPFIACGLARWAHLQGPPAVVTEPDFLVI